MAIIEGVKNGWKQLVLLSPYKYTVIRDGEAGGRLRWGSVVENLGPGYHWGTTGTELEKDWVRGCDAEIQGGGVECYSSDQVPLLVTGACRYDIVDYRAYSTNSEDIGKTLDHYLAAATVRVIEQYTAGEVVGLSETIEGEILSRMNDDVAEWGISVTLVRLTGRTVQDEAAKRALCLGTILQSARRRKPLNPGLAALLVSAVPVNPVTAESEE